MVKHRYLKQYAHDVSLKLEQYTDWFWLGSLVVCGSLVAWEGVFFFREKPFVSGVLLLAGAIVYWKIRSYQRAVNAHNIKEYLQKQLFREKLNQQPAFLYQEYGCRIDALSRLLQGLPQDSSRKCKCFFMEDNHLVSAQQVWEAIVNENAAVLVADTDFSQKARDFIKAQQKEDILLLTQNDIFKWVKWRGELADDEEIERYLLKRQGAKVFVRPQRKIAIIFLWGTFLFLLSLVMEPFELYYLAALLFYSMGFYQYLQFVWRGKSLESKNHFQKKV